MVGQRKEQASSGEAPKPNGFEQARTKFNDALLGQVSGYDSTGLQSSLSEASRKLGLGISKTNSLQRGARYGMMVVMYGQAADVAEKNGDAASAEAFKKRQDHFKTMAELLDPAKKKQPLPAAGNMQGAKS